MTRERRSPADDETGTAAPFVPARRTLPAMREAVQGCRGCDLYKEATQAVFGEGSARARIMFIGEQPGDSEDLAGKPFVGPAGKLLDDALEAAGVPRDAAYVTNAVKHFKFTRRGKRRIHDKPNRYERDACRPWLDAELEVVAPEIVVLLGATAAQGMLGSKFKVTAMRGQVLSAPWAPYVIATVHPSSVLRAPDDEQRRAARAAFFADIAVVGACYRKLGEGVGTARRENAPGRSA
jgi:uracil-DNA glycosylase family protein